MTGVSVRYIVNDVDAAIAFYTLHLGFRVEMHPGPGFGALSRGDLRLLLNTPGGSGGAGEAMPDGRRPEPVTGRGGRQILLDDPAGNAVELFEPS